TAARGIVHGGSIRHGRVACPLARAGAYQERLWSPRSPCPDLTSVLADFLTSWASERPRSSLSLNFPSSSRRTSRLSPLGAISSRLLLFLVAMLRLLEPLNQPPVGRPMHWASAPLRVTLQPSDPASRPLPSPGPYAPSCRRPCP